MLRRSQQKPGETYYKTHVAPKMTSQVPKLSDLVEMGSAAKAVDGFAKPLGFQRCFSAQRVFQAPE